MTRRGWEEREPDWTHQQASQDSGDGERTRTFYEQLHRSVGNRAVQRMVEGDQRETGQQDTENEGDTDRGSLRRRFRQLRRRYCLNSPRVPGSNQLDTLPEVAWRNPDVTERFLRAGLGPEILSQLEHEAWQEPDRVLNAVRDVPTGPRRWIGFDRLLGFATILDVVAVERIENTIRGEVPDLVRGTGSESTERQEELRERLQEMGRQDLLSSFENYRSRDLDRIARAMFTRNNERRRWPNGEPLTVIEEEWPAGFVLQHMDTLWQLEQVGSTSALARNATPVEKQALVEGLSELVQTDPELTDRAMNELPTGTLPRVGSHLATITSAYDDRLVDTVLELGAELSPREFERLTGELATDDASARRQYKQRVRNLSDQRAREYLRAIAEGRNPESLLNDGPSNGRSTQQDGPPDDDGGDE